MLTDIKLKSLKPRGRAYKVADRDGLYVVVSPAGVVTFRYDYRLQGRRETLTLGRFDPYQASLQRRITPRVTHDRIELDLELSLSRKAG